MSKPTHYVVHHQGKQEFFAKRRDARVFRIGLLLRGIPAHIEARGF